MNEWFAGLDARERLFVSVGASVVVFALFWFALWMPLDRGERNLAASIGNWQSSLAELRPLQNRLAQNNASPSPQATNQSLVVIVDNTLRSHGLYDSLQRSQPTTNDGIRVEFESVAFDDLVLWLGDLASQYGLHVDSASFSVASGNEAGRVNASVTLER